MAGVTFVARGSTSTNGPLGSSLVFRTLSLLALSLVTAAGLVAVEATPAAAQDESAKEDTTQEVVVDYYLPWTAGQSHPTTQQPGGSFSHSCPGRSCFAYDFSGRGWEVKASAPGVVVELERDARGQTGRGGRGNYVKVQHADGLCSRYLHMEHQSLPSGIQVGAPVTQGQTLGRTGNTGYTRPYGSGYHLHFTVADCDTDNSVPITFVEPLPTAGPAVSLNSFAGETFSFDAMAGVDGSVVRLYAAAFRRDPDLDGFVHWRYSGLSVVQMAKYFMASEEWQESYGSLSEDEFVDLIYRNVLERSPDEIGLEYWTEIAESSGRTAVLLGFSESLEFRNQTNTL